MVGSIKNINLYLDSILKLMAILFRLGIFVGVFIFFIYCSRIGYFPTSVGLGDGILFLIISGCFGLLYIFFILCLLSFGMWFYPILIGIKIFFVRLSKAIDGESNDPHRWYKKVDVTFIKPSMDTFAFGIAGAGIVFILGKNDYYIVIKFILLSMFLVLCFSTVINLNNKIRNLKTDIKYMDIKNMGVSSEAINIENIKHRKNQIMFILFFLISPLFYSEMLKLPLNVAMEMTGFRRKLGVVYVKKPFSELMPSSYYSHKSRKIKDYSAFYNVLILFKGLGENVVIKFVDEQGSKKLIIPKDSVLIV